ncbi:MAG TPA: ABC transporter permease [Gemmatimonadaceae bacterium]|jgi:predicted permease|nr:ABC transporter permease [Gemmatimonadaceae bacterium]
MKRVFRSAAVRPDASRDVRDEIQFHIEMRTREFIEQGLSPEDARRAALAAFGDTVAVDAELSSARATYLGVRARRDRLGALRTDLVFALRTLRKRVGFTAAALATLALGIGAAASVYTIVNGVLVRPLPYPDPSRLVMVWMSDKEFGAGLPLTSGFYLDAAEAAAPFATTAAFRQWSYALSGAGDAEQVQGARVTPSFFPTIGVRPQLGRALNAADAEQGASHVVVISDALWRRRFGGDPTIIGKRITLGGEPFAVVGIMPRGFAFPRGAELPAGLQFAPRADLWTPLAFTERDRRSYSVMNLSAIARLGPGVPASRLQSTLTSQLREFLDANAPTVDLSYHLATLKEQAGQHVRRTLLVLLGAVALLLVIACANVTNLLIARTGARAREFAVRAALGAGRMRIARQLITENVLLALLGTAIGLAVSMWATRAMLSLVPGSLPRADDVRLDWRVGTLAFAITIVVGAALGTAAAMQVRWSRLADVLRGDAARAGASRSRGVARRLLIVAEVSLSAMLVVGAALLAESFVRLQRVEPGFDPSQTLAASVALPITGAFDVARDGPSWSRFFSELQGRLARSPGIISAGASSALPLTSAVEGGGTAIVGEPTPPPGQAKHAAYIVTEGDYFATLGIRLLQGRAFTSTDLATTTPVAIVNREYARRYLHGNAVGRQLIAYFDFSKQVPRTIVGVVDDVRYGPLDAPPDPQVYVPEQQMTYPALQIVLRTAGDPMALLPLLTREVKAINPSLAVAAPRTMESVFSESLAARRFAMTLIGIFAASALVLAMVGLYGVIALGVSERRREIGVRMALGAAPARVLRLVIREGVTLAAVGLVVGLAGAFAASRLVAAMLYGVSPSNATAYLATAFVVLVVAGAATWLPARRATRVDPASALRD